MIFFAWFFIEILRDLERKNKGNFELVLLDGFGKHLSICKCLLSEAYEHKIAPLGFRI